MARHPEDGGQRKILIFAHVPPPYHGQSVMVKVLLDGLLADSRFEVHHVDARVSDDLEDVGTFRFRKSWRLFKCILRAWWIRLRYGRMAFYYVPAPAKGSAIIRDWLVMAMCRPFFPELILHWHAYGLGEWAAEGSDWQRKFTRRALDNADLSIVLNDYNRRDAEVFAPKRVEIVPNGIADLFPDYETTLAPKREARAAMLKALLDQGTTGPMDERTDGLVGGELESEMVGRSASMKAGEDQDGKVGIPETETGATSAKSNVGNLEKVRFLFLGHLIETKGVFAAIEAINMANDELRKSNAPWRAFLTLAGSSASEGEKVSVENAVEAANHSCGDEGPCVTLAGFLDSGQKKSALEEADCLVFPTFYEGETQGLVLLEAMSAGLPVITTSWRGIPEVLPCGYRLVVAPASRDELARAMVDWVVDDSSMALRQRYKERYTISKHVELMADKLSGLTK